MRRPVTEDKSGAPVWPELMDARMAAAYMGVGVRSLRLLLRRFGVAPLELGVRLRRWRRSDLDALIAALPLSGQTLFGDSCASPGSGVDCALHAVERRMGATRRTRSDRR